MFVVWLRRIHLYAALFLIPWITMYAVSTVVMNHSDHFGGSLPQLKFEKVMDRSYRGTLPDAATSDQIAIQLLDELDLPGRYRARRDEESGAVVIHRDSPRVLRRITYQPATAVITIEAANRGTRGFLHQFHRRSGFGWNSIKEDAWGLSVDMFVFAMLFWTFSGLCMWWQIRSTRRLGWLSLGLGIVLFMFFLLAI